MPNNFDYFISFYRHKIENGEKQIDLSKSTLINKSPQYIHNLYKGEPKSCPIDVQRGIAAYYEISYEDMLAEGRVVYEKENLFEGIIGEVSPSEGSSLDNEITDPEKQRNLLVSISKGIISNSKTLEEIQKKAKKVEELSKEIHLLNKIFNNLNEGVTFFDAKREFVFSSNRWNLLDGVDLSSNPSIEEIVIHIRKKIENLDEVLDTIVLVVENPNKEVQTDVKFFSGHIFNFRIVPLFEDEIFIGTLLVDTVKHTPESNT